MIIAVGATRLIQQASWPAPDTMSRWLSPRRSAALRTVATRPGSNVTGSKWPVDSISIPSPSSAAIRGASASSRARIVSSFSRSGLRKSIVKTAFPGITLRLLG